MTEERRRCEQLLADNIELLIEHADEIIAEPRYYWCAPAASLWGRTTGPTQFLPLGALVQAWRDGRLQGCLRATGERVYVYASVGSALSGRGWHAGVCVPSGRIVKGDSCGGTNILDVEPFRLTAEYIEGIELLAEKTYTREAATIEEVISTLPHTR